MARKKSLLAEAIAEAKVVRAAAIQNATKQLEENMTPSIKEMLAKQLEEELDLNENEEENIEENANSGFKEVKPKKTVSEEDEPDEEPADDENAEEPAEDEDIPADEGSEEDVPEDLDDEPAGDTDEDGTTDDTPISDLTLGDLKDLISDLVAASAAPAPGGEEGVDLEPGDVEGAGEEAAPGGIEAAGSEGMPMDNSTDLDNGGEEASDDEIDISEILKELEEEEKGNKCPECGKEKCTCENKQNAEMPENQNGKEHHKEPNNGGPSQDSELDELKKENKKLKKENKDLQEGVQKLSKTLREVNLLNAKLSAATKLVGKPGLTESQKAHVIKTLDKAKTTKEVALLSKTMLESLRKQGLKTLVESRQAARASRSAGLSTMPKGQQVMEEGLVRRFQELAGIIKD